MLNSIALSTDRQQALAIAQRARQTVVDWPKTHYGYRQNDIREIVSLLDQAISSLRAVGGSNPFELSLVATAGPPELEPVLGMPNVKEQIDQMMRLASITTAPTERMALLQGALGLVAEAGPAPGSRCRGISRRSRTSDPKRAGRRPAIHRSLAPPAGSGRSCRPTCRRSGDRTHRARVASEDKKLGQKRPQIVEALNTSLQGKLADSRRLRLLRDQWALRRDTYRQYQQLGRIVAAPAREIHGIASSHPHARRPGSRLSS